MTPFDPLQTASWPLVLTADHVATIYHRPILGLKKACQKNRFLPSPYRTKPYLWRKVDVLRDVEGVRSIEIVRRRA